MARVGLPFLLGHAEIAYLFEVERQTSRKWRTEGTLAEPDLVISGNPYWLLDTVLRINGVGGRRISPQRLAAYQAAIPGGQEATTIDELPVIVGLKEVARIHGRDDQAVSRWRNRRQISEPDILLSGSPLWLLETILRDGQRRGRTIFDHEVQRLREGHRDPQKPRGRRTATQHTRRRQ
ncbi:hypothetical protein [Streptomyces sp. NPDC127098]|uniref:hypothetical protein n=1 Tax=Streptomyces sp. NPDC127098 TaxID=3347137 RepID=UPI0036482211